MERVSVVFGGSILAPAQPDPAFLVAAARAVLDWSRERQVFLVTGGGQPARQAIAAARAAGVAEPLLDRIGIQATRLNAQGMACLLHHLGADVELDVPTTVAQALRLAERHRIVVMGGTVPGHSTDHVAAELAIQGGCARLVDATNVDGVYTEDPKRNPAATMVPELDFAGLLRIIGDPRWTSAGAPGVVDGPASLILAAAGMTTCVVHGMDLPNLGAAVAGKAFRGTRVAGQKVVTP